MPADPPSISSSLLEDVRDLLRQSRGRAYAAVNAIMVDAYWNIGRRIVEEEQGGRERAGYGSQLIRSLARGLGDESAQASPWPTLKTLGSSTSPSPMPEKATHCVAN